MHSATPYGFARGINLLLGRLIEPSHVFTAIVAYAVIATIVIRTLAGALIREWMFPVQIALVFFVAFTGALLIGTGLHERRQRWTADEKPISRGVMWFAAAALLAFVPMYARYYVLRDDSLFLLPISGDQPATFLFVLVSHLLLPGILGFIAGIFGGIRDSDSEY